MMRDMPMMGYFDDLCDPSPLGKMHRKSFPATNVTQGKEQVRAYSH